MARELTLLVMVMCLKVHMKIIADMDLDSLRKLMVNIVKKIGRRISWSTLILSRKKMPNKLHTVISEQ